MKQEYDQRKFIAQAKTEKITVQAQIYIDEHLKKGEEEGGDRPS